MPKPKRKSKRRSEMSNKELTAARAADKARIRYPKVDITQRDLDALNAMVDAVEKRPTYKKLIKRADTLHRGYSETRGRKGLRAVIQRLHIRAGRQLTALRIPLPHSHLITLKHEEHTKEMRFLMLEDLYAQHPETTLILLEFTHHEPFNLDIIIDGHLFTELLIKSNIPDFEERHRNLLILWEVALDCYPTCQVPPPFINPYSDTLNS